MRNLVLISLVLFLGCSGSDLVGPAGPQGSPGATGAMGQTGASGQGCTIDGNLVVCGDTSYAFDYTVQLCPGTPSYPSTFIEYGICIDNQLYGVYSENDGFLTLLPPGSYSSDGINASCDLTIKPNCVVTNP